MFLSMIAHLPNAIFNSIFLLAILWLIYQFIAIKFKCSASKLYLIAIVFQFLSAINFMLELFSFPFFNFINSFKFSQISFGANNFSLLNTQDHFLLFVAIVYSLALLVLLTKFFVQSIHLNKLIKKTDFANTHIFENYLLETVGDNSKKIKIGLNESIHTPMVFGVFEHIILLPISLCNHLSAEQLKFILVHEFAHILRNDFLINLVVEFTGIILWFNPFVYKFKKQIQLQREIACDHIVLGTLNEPLSYSKVLYDIASQNFIQVNSLSLAAIKDKSDLKFRIQYLNGMGKNSIHKIPLLISILAIPLCLLIHNVITPIQSNNPKKLLVKYENTNFASNTILTKIKVHKDKSYTKVSHKKSSIVKNKPSLVDIDNQLNNDINDSKSVADLSYQELVKQTKDWIKLHESNVVQTNYNEVNNVIKAKEAYEDDLANKLLLLSIIKNYKLKKSILEQKIKNATDSNEARDFILNSEEWKEIEQYEKWAKEFLHRQ